MGNKRGKLSLLLSTQIYDQWQYLSYFESLLQNLLCATHCMLLKWVFFFQRGNLCLGLKKLKVLFWFTQLFQSII